MPDALPQGSFVFSSGRCCSFLSLFSAPSQLHTLHFCCNLRAPSALHCSSSWLPGGTASLQISVCAVKASRDKNTKQNFLLSLLVPGTNTVPLLCPRNLEYGSSTASPCSLCVETKVLCPDLIVMDVFLLENISLLTDCAVFLLAVFF